MKQVLNVASIIFLCLFSITSIAQTQSIDFQGLKSNNQGLVLWHNLSNPAQKGYVIQNYFPNVPRGCVTYAYYFMASADQDNFNPRATTGATGTGTAQGFTNFKAALQRHGKSLSNFHYRFSTTNMGNKVEGTDYKIDRNGSKEERYYTGGRFEFLIDNTVILSGAMPKMTAKIAYNNQSDCRDDALSGKSAYFRSITKASGLSASLNQIADAFKRDVSGTGKMMQFELLNIRPASAGVEDFGGNGLQGGFFDIQLGKLKVVKISVPNRPIFNFTWSGQIVFPFKKSIKQPDYSGITINIVSAKGKVKKSIRPDKKGKFSAKLPAGNYKIMVKKKGLKTYTSNLTLKKNTYQKLTLK